MNTILICPDKFKGSLSADDVANSIAKGVKSYNAEIQTILCPLADGGEGSIDIINERIGAVRVDVKVSDPLGRIINSYYYKKGKKAYIEMSKASGLALLAIEEYNPMTTSTFGTGEMIVDAMENGCRDIFLFIGGSSTNDAGLGMARAVGYKFLSEDKVTLKGGGADMNRLNNVVDTDIHLFLSETKFFVVCDVANPFYGPNGAAFVYAEQKGANPSEIMELDKGLQNVSNIIKTDLGSDISNLKGAGAAGGLGGGAVAFLDAEIVSGVKTIMELIEFEKFAERADLIITGEGKLDEQSLQGKVVKGVIDYGKVNNKKVAVLVGKNSLGGEAFDDLQLAYCMDIMSISENVNEAMTQAADKLELLSYTLVKDLS